MGGRALIAKLITPLFNWGSGLAQLDEINLHKLLQSVLWVFGPHWNFLVGSKTPNLLQFGLLYNGLSGTIRIRQCGYVIAAENFLPKPGNRCFPKLLVLWYNVDGISHWMGPPFIVWIRMDSIAHFSLELTTLPFFLSGYAISSEQMS